MIYLIGGLPRTGKSFIANLVASNHDAPSMDTDHIRAMLDADPSSRASYASGAPIDEVMVAAEPYLRELIGFVDTNTTDFILSGELITPSLVSRAGKAGRIRSVFLGIGDAAVHFESIRGHQGYNDWTSRFSDERLMAILVKYVERSKALERRCSDMGLTYVDVSKGFEPSLMNALEALGEDGLGDVELHGRLLRWLGQ